MSEEQFSSTNNVIGDELVDPDYRAISPLAVIGLVLGLSSVAAFLHPLFFVVPVAAVLACTVALRQASDLSSGVSGRAVAQLGLAAALLFGGGGIAYYFSRQYVALHEARSIAQQWFLYLADGQPQHAHQLMVEPAKRLPPGADAWKSYRESDNLQSALRTFAESPVGKALLGLGHDAQVRAYDLELQFQNHSKDQVREVYAVTFEDQGKKKSFFVRLTLLRTTDEASGITGWRIADWASPVLPEAWPQAPAPTTRAR